jgi:hypothetical protein
VLDINIKAGAQTRKDCPPPRSMMASIAADTP